MLDYGQLLTFGSNKCGQLGLGDFRDHPYINLVSGSLLGCKVTQVSCGDSFTVIATDGKQSTILLSNRGNYRSIDYESKSNS